MGVGYRDLILRPYFVLLAQGEIYIEQEES